MFAELSALFAEYRQIDELLFTASVDEKQSRLREVRESIARALRRVGEEFGHLVSRDIKNIEELLETSKEREPPIIRAESPISRHASRKNSPEMKAVSPKERPETVALTRPLILYWMGHWYFLTGRMPEAEHYLVKSAKLDPRLCDAWNVLGQVYLEKGDVVVAKCCYESALQFAENALSYVHLSKILRDPRLAKTLQERCENAKESLQMANRALKFSRTKGVHKDGELWFCLGNAYLTMFNAELQSGMPLVGDEKSDEENLLDNTNLRKCLTAYNLAETKCSVNPHNTHPDLFFNRSSAHKFFEDYQSAFDDLNKAREFGDRYVNAEQHLGNLAQMCTRLHKICARGGNKLAKRVQAWKGQIEKVGSQVTRMITAQQHFDCVHLNDLEEGLNGGRVLVLKLLQALPKESLPSHYVVTDGRGDVWILSSYLRKRGSHIINLCSQNTVQVSNLVTICNPVTRKVRVHVEMDSSTKRELTFKIVTFAQTSDLRIGGRSI